MTRILLLLTLMLATALPAVPLSAHDETREAAERRREQVERNALAQADTTTAKLGDDETAAVVVRLVDDATGKPLPGLVRIKNADDRLAIRLPNEIHRAANWFSLDAEASLRLPRRRLVIEAIHGLDTERAERTVDLTDGTKQTVELRLRRFTLSGAREVWAGNTHLHLRGLSIAEMDRYLRLVPQTDGLEVVFVSHLRRAVEERDYTSNILTTADLARLSEPHRLFGNGEEHRHNFGAGGEGYGHVLFLNIKQLIQPVSIGPGIMLDGTDGLPLRTGIDAARADDAAIIWCHNRFGLEDVPNWLTERIDAQNIHDGSQVHGSYDETYYRYLNLGLSVPFSTGTDWFIYDFSRVYVPRAKATTAAAWLDELRAGRTCITNGPLLEFTLDKHNIGDRVQIDKPTTLRARGRGIGRSDFSGLELIHNGRVLTTAKSQPSQGHFTAELESDVPIDAPGWYALRIPLAQSTNELEQKLFAHTSPIYVDFAGRRVFQREPAEACLAEMRRALEVIPKQGKFANDAERERVISVYRSGIQTLEQRLATK